MSGNGDAPDMVEPVRWKCDEPGCNVSGRAANKKDANLARRLHKDLMHPKPKRK